MKRKLKYLFIGLGLALFFAWIGKPQKVASWFQFGRLNVDSSMRIPRDTFASADSGAIAAKLNNFYVKNGSWHLITGTGSGSGTDSAAYYGFTGLNDSTLIFLRKNGHNDTLVFRITGGSGGTGGSGLPDTLSISHLGPIYNFYASTDHKSIVDKGWTAADVFTTPDSINHLKKVPHGISGNLLYYAPDGSAYTIPVINDTTNGQLEFQGFTLFDKTVSIKRTGITGNTVMDAFIAENLTPASAGNMQNGGEYYSNGSVWTGSGSHTNRVRWGNKPTFLMSTEIPDLVFEYQLNGGSWLPLFDVGMLGGPVSMNIANIGASGQISAAGAIFSSTAINTDGSVRGQIYSQSTYPITTNHTLGAIEGQSVVQGSGGPFTVTLPLSTGSTGGYEYTIFNNSTTPTTFVTTSSQIIYGPGGSGTSYILSPGCTVTFQATQTAVTPIWIVKSSANSDGGTYTPTLTNVANATGTLTANLGHWTRAGNQINVNGQFVVGSVTAINTTTQVGISLPVASNLTSFYDCLGPITIKMTANAGLGGGIEGDITNDRAQATFYPTVTTSYTCYYSFTYTVK